MSVRLPVLVGDRIERPHRSVFLMSRVSFLSEQQIRHVAVLRNLIFGPVGGVGRYPAVLQAQAQESCRVGSDNQRS